MDRQHLLIAVNNFFAHNSRLTAKHNEAVIIALEKKRARPKLSNSSLLRYTLAMQTPVAHTCFAGHRINTAGMVLAVARAASPVGATRPDRRVR